MNPKHLVVIVALLVGFAVFLVLARPMWWKDSGPAGDPDAMARLQDRMTAAEKELAATKSALERQEAAINRALDAYAQAALAKRGAAEGAMGQPGEPGVVETAGPGARAASRPAGDLTLEAAIEGLLSDKLDWDDEEKLWKRIREAGLTDAIIKELEKRVAANPKDADLQTELGNAYLKKIEEVPQGPESGAWATKADQAYDKALELNPEHWESRFMKATALSFWPPVFGKQGEAVKHYETLVAQQERQTAQDAFAETYYFLGNMYQQMGQIDQALSTWQRGLKLFPDSKNLQEQIANAGSLRR
jgi:tetratricopeptide (TPR) repeat protein